ncbi:MAG: hypothetical protein U9P00_05970 [Pseudomonadota bacterium]|nr:hypothetical protein [Pseudomonadota bacterium]
MKNIQVGDQFTYLPGDEPCTVVACDQWTVSMQHECTDRIVQVSISNVNTLYHTE